MIHSRETIEGSAGVRDEIIVGLARAPSRPEIDRVLAEHAALLSELLPADRSAVLREYARLSSTLPSVSTPTLLVERYLSAFVVASLLALVAFLQMLLMPTSNFFYGNDLHYFVTLRLDDKTAFRITNSSAVVSSLPAWPIIAAAFIAAAIFGARAHGRRLGSVVLVLLIPTLVPILFGAARLITTSEREAIFVAGQRYGLIRLYLEETNVDAKRVVERGWQRLRYAE